MPSAHKQIFLDTETTGLYANRGDRIVEVAAVCYEQRRPTEARFHRYVNPQRPSDPEALRVHGLTEDFLATQPLFEAIAEEFLAFVRDAEIIIHNASFDVGFIDAELERLNLGRLADYAHSIIDSLQLAKDQYPGQRNSLDALCKRLDVDNSHRNLHGALIDADLLAEVYIRMTRSQHSFLEEELSASISTDVPSSGATSTPHSATNSPRIDLGGYNLPVLQADEAEKQAHQLCLAGLDKDSGGKTLWKILNAPSS